MAKDAVGYFVISGVVCVGFFALLLLVSDSDREWILGLMPYWTLPLTILVWVLLLWCFGSRDNDKKNR
jgi:hypothetical protein